MEKQLPGGWVWAPITVFVPLQLNILTELHFVSLHVWGKPWEPKVCPNIAIAQR